MDPNSYEAYFWWLTFPWLIAIAIVLVISIVISPLFAVNGIMSILFGLAVSYFLKPIDTIWGYINDYIEDSIFYVLVCIVRVVKKYILKQGLNDGN